MHGPNLIPFLSRHFRFSVLLHFTCPLFVFVKFMLNGFMLHALFQLTHHFFYVCMFLCCLLFNPNGNICTNTFILLEQTFLYIIVK